MKYCKKCKLLAKSDESNCRQCGEPVGALGIPKAATNGSAAAPALGLQGKIQELTVVKQRNVRRMRFLIGLCALIVFAMLIIGYQVYSHNVLSYAVLDNVEIQQDEFEQNRIHVKFDVVKPGKVAFDRGSGDSRTEKLDVFSSAGPVSLSWAWPSSRSIDFKVIYRTGLTKTADERNLTVDRSGRALDIVFLMDKTRSMTPFIKALKRKCIDFANTVNGEGYDCRLGLVGFGDLEINEPIEVFKPTDNVNLFQQQIDSLKVTGGGDEPESSVEALDRALTLDFRKGARVCMVHITDASCHNAERIPQIARKLRDRSIVSYVVSTQENANLYAQLCGDGGKFVPIDDAKFDNILDYVAQSLVSEIRYQ